MSRAPRIFHSEKVHSPFQGVTRIDVTEFLTEQGTIDEPKLRTFVENHCVENGDPLVVSNFQSLPSWDQEEFSLDRLKILSNDLEYEIYDVKRYERMDRIPFAEFLSRIKYPQGQRPRKRGRKAALEDDNENSSNKSQRTSLESCIKRRVSDDDNSSQSDSDGRQTVPERVPESKAVLDISVNEYEQNGKRQYTNEGLDSDHCSGSNLNPKGEENSSQQQSVPEPMAIDESRITRRIARIGKRTVSSNSSQIDSDEDERGRMQLKNKQCQGEPLYCKDMICPESYRQKLQEMIPEFLLPLGHNDLFKNFPTANRPESQMCYIGGTHSGTALHRDICGTFGHNLMTFAEPNAYSEWIMIKNEHRDKLLSTFHEPQSNDSDGLLEYQRKFNKKSSFIECDRAWISPAQLREANIPATIIIQQPGDLVIVPSLYYHQVRNFGVSTKVAWNRSTLQSLELALEEQLPVYKSVNRPEVFRCKAMMFYTLQLWERLLSDYVKSREDNKQVRIEDIKELSIGTFGWDHFVEECRLLAHLFMKHAVQPETIETIPFEGVSDKDIPTDTLETTPFTLVCNFCRCDIFHRFYRCEHCYDFELCLDCYAKGRGCEHLTDLKMYQSPKEFSQYKELVDNFISTVNKARGFEVLFGDIYHGRYGSNIHCYSLATICRRIEMYRKAKANNCNQLTCGHCGKTANLTDIYYNHRMDLMTIFGRLLCIKAIKYDKKDVIYTCWDCTKSCRHCLPIHIPDNEEAEKHYFWEAQNDMRNWGGITDKGFLSTYHWPDRVLL